MVNNENEILKSFRNADKIIQQEKDEYLEKFKEFAKFVESDTCKIQEEVSDE